MLFKALSAAVYGIDANLIDVEVDYSGVVTNEDHFHTVGLPDAAVRESRDRVRAAIKNSGYLIPPTFITINLAPADIKKEGSGFDLPIAVGILGAYGALRSSDLSRFLMVGELGLDGSVRPIPGMLPIAILAREKGIPNLILPAANAAEAAVVEGVNVYPVSSLLDVLDLLNTSVVGVIQREPYRVATEDLLGKLEQFSVDFSDVRGQQTAKRALEVAAAGSHNILMIGPPGSGKTMLAKRLPSILAPLTFEEALETTKIHSVAGVLEAGCGPRHAAAHSARRTTPSPTQASSAAASCRVPAKYRSRTTACSFSTSCRSFPATCSKSCASRLRITPSPSRAPPCRSAFPARFMLAAAMNPCPCGYFNDKSRECMCTPPMIQRYVAKISGPLLDRIDIHIEVPAVQYKELRGGAATEGSAQIRARVMSCPRAPAPALQSAQRKNLRQRADDHAPDSRLLRIEPRRRAPARARHAAAGPHRPRPRSHPQSRAHHRRP